MKMDDFGVPLVLETPKLSGGFYWFALQESAAHS